MQYKKITKNPARFTPIGNDKVMVLFEDNTTEYHTIVEVTEYFNNNLLKPQQIANNTAH